MSEKLNILNKRSIVFEQFHSGKVACWARYRADRRCRVLHWQSMSRLVRIRGSGRGLGGGCPRLLLAASLPSAWRRRPYTRGFGFSAHGPASRAPPPLAWPAGAVHSVTGSHRGLVAAPTLLGRCAQWCFVLRAYPSLRGGSCLWARSPPSVRHQKQAVPPHQCTALQTCTAPLPPWARMVEVRMGH